MDFVITFSLRKLLNTDQNTNLNLTKQEEGGIKFYP